MRSFHRYASDGIVLGMLLHLVRHFVFDHHRGFQWFSWISGVVLLWLVYAAGVNGYMLPWDRLAQFVVVGTTEWFDWLPIFNGRLVRNFLFEGSVNDRLFSLLSFLHIGLPLGILALLWIHTQRVPRAKTNPPWPIAVGLSIALLILSLVKPVVSQGQAELSAAVTEIDLDWFYLNVLPLLYSWSPSKVWALVGGTTLLFVLLPWLPPKRGARTFHLMVHPDNRIIGVREGETILDAGLREGLAMPFECRNGGCGVCKGTLLYGSVDYGAYQESALTEAEKQAGKVLFCCATPLSDLELEYQPTAAPGGIPLRTYTARVVQMNKLADDVMQVFLRLPGGEKIDFYAGQYINILLADGQKRSFSFATAPHENEVIELQIRLVPDGKFTTHVFTQLQVGDEVRFEGPLGFFFLREDSDKPIIFVAGSTGFAPVKSMVEHALHIGMKRQMILYWGVRTLKDLYLAELPERWQKEHDNFKFVPVLSEPQPEDHWRGRTGLVHEAILQDFPDLSDYQIYACGSVKMVEAAHPAFIAKGISQDDCFSDAFRLAPHAKVRSEAAELVKLGGTQ
jgi:NAD(P)H-flavin reductase/ferredoxin